jgi:hypothetical protein
MLSKSLAAAGASVYASRLEHSLHAGVHFLFLDEFAAGYLVDANLDLLLEPIVMRQQAGNRFLDELIGSPAGLHGKLVELNFLGLRQVYFHRFKGRVADAACQARGIAE